MSIPRATTPEGLLVAGTVSSLERQEADIACQKLPIGYRKVMYAEQAPTGYWPPGEPSLGYRPLGRTGDQISVCSEISKASSTSIPK